MLAHHGPYLPAFDRNPPVCYHSLPPLPPQSHCRSTWLQAVADMSRSGFVTCGHRYGDVNHVPQVYRAQGSPGEPGKSSVAQGSSGEHPLVFLHGIPTLWMGRNLWMGRYIFGWVINCLRRGAHDSRGAQGISGGTRGAQGSPRGHRKVQGVQESTGEIRGAQEISGELMMGQHVFGWIVNYLRPRAPNKVAIRWPRAYQDVPEHPRALQSVPERPRAPQSVPERPRASQSAHQSFAPIQKGKDRRGIPRRAFPSEVAQSHSLRKVILDGSVVLDGSNHFWMGQTQQGRDKVEIEHPIRYPIRSR